MKKILLLSLALLTTLSFYSCKDDNDKSLSEANIDRLFRPMFRTDNNTGKGTNDPYNSIVTDYNTMNLFWYLVDDAVAYEIMWVSPYSWVASGEEGWTETVNKVDGKSLEGHVVVADPNRYSLIIEHLKYQMTYRFCIRALNSFDPTGYQLWRGEANVYDVLDTPDAAWKNDSRNSEWYGRGNEREWADYFHRDATTTLTRDWEPFVVQVSDVTKTSMKLTINRSIANYSDADKEKFREHWNFVDGEKNLLKVDYLTFTANASTPNATLNPTYVKYTIPEDAWGADGVLEIVVDNLSENSCYNIDVWDDEIPYEVDACYNTQMKRTKGDPAPPQLIKHVVWEADTMGTDPATWTIYDVSEYKAMKLDQILNDYCESATTPENQVFYLEGGKNYFVSTNVQIFKGLTLQTNPADTVAGGKGRAKLFLAGMYKSGSSIRTCNFMIGRQPKAGENASITLDIDTVRFMDLDVDVPMATNFGHAQEGIGSAVGNYFMNMYSNGMGVNVTTIEWHRCSFQGIVRGFFRVQGSNNYTIHNLKMIDCETYNCGYYQANGGGFNYFHGDCDKKPKSNIFENIEVSGCVFYNSPKGSMITDNNRNVVWDESVRWHINVHHNTFVNFNTLNNTAIINTRYNPGGSLLEFHDNVIILTRDAADVTRKMGSAGWDTRNVQGGDGSGKVTFNIYNNWTTNDEWNTNGQPFASNAFSATSNAPKKWFKEWGEEFYPASEAELTVHLEENLKATDLMVSPNLKYQHNPDAPKHTDFRTETGIDGLYYQQTPAVLNSSIYNSGAGAPMLRNGK